MDNLGHEFNLFYTCVKCGIGQHEANIGGIVCTGAEDDECDTPLIVSEQSDG